MRRQFDDIMLGSLELFCIAAELESFTAAGRAAGLSPAAVSRSIARLETRLGVRLFMRTTRQIHLTDVGRTYFEQCRQALNLMRDAEAQLTGAQQAPAGKLRLSIASPYGHYRVLPLLPRFRAHYPKVEIEIHLGNRNIDFTAEGFDVAIRGRTPPDSGLIARKLEDAELVLVAAPSYIAHAGVPDSLDALDQHDCVQFMLPSTGLPVPWLFRTEGRDVELSTPQTYRCAEDYLGAVTLARQGAGILQTYRYIVQDDLAQGRLQELLPEAGGRSRPFSLLYPHRHHTPLRVRAFIDFLLAALTGGDAKGTTHR
ncbi:LysR family transcriptional regulator [Variovorax sp. RT4R15]|uniref:LysR family transcriptional regulator n=1 Tax=Variovorax sp. RT4R15 TaxID=3443737 RepID=UPI003F464425